MQDQDTLIFGEVLYDCFPSGEKVLGGAPFNVAWHLQALGHHPLFISRVGEDESGHAIAAAMQSWGMETTALQRDPQRATGRVEVQLQDGEPQYEITEGVAYDYIDAAAVPVCESEHVLYHGSLALRNQESRQALAALACRPGCAIFFDVNLRAPWWNKEEIENGLHRTRWAKMNVDELRALGFDDDDVGIAMRRLQVRFGVAIVLVTLGREGAALCSESGDVTLVPPAPLKTRVDPVGAGDALSAMFIHGLRTGCSAVEAVEKAQVFATRIIAMRGATPAHRDFYADFVNG